MARPRKASNKEVELFIEEEIATVEKNAVEGTEQKKEADAVARPVNAEEQERKAPVYDADTVQKMIAQAVAQAVAQVKAEQTAPQIIQYAAETEKVHFLWQAEVADENVVYFGENGMYGQIVGKTGSFFVPKDELSRVLTEINRFFLKKRWLIIISGLTQEERISLGVDYKDGELLDRAAFDKIVSLGNKMVEIYPELCDGHKAIVAQRYAEAYEQGNPYVTREIVVALNELSKTEENPRGAFVGIVEKMNADQIA